MSPKRKKIRELTPEEVKELTDDEVMERIFNKKTLKELKRAIEKADDKGKKDND